MSTSFSKEKQHSKRSVESDNIRITLDVPAPLLARIQETLGRGPFPSRNRLILQAVREFLDRFENARIDGEFEQIQYDEKYKEMNLKVAEEFEPCDREASSVRKR